MSIPGPAAIGSAPRLRALTGIRIIAAIAVFNAHVVPAAGTPAPFRALSVAGHDWMTMFFMLSGLILTWNYDELLGERLNGRGLRTYFVARFARIYPLYLLALAFAVAASTRSGGAILATLTNGTFWLHVFALQTWSGNLGIAYGYNGPGWSIGVEFFLYALFPLLLPLVARARNNPRALVMIAIGAVVLLLAITVVFGVAGLTELPHTDPDSAHRWLYRTPLTRVPDFVLGIALGYLIKFRSSMPTTPRLERGGRIAQAASAIVIIGIMFVPAIADSVWSYDVINMIPFGFVMLGLVWAPDTVLARFLGSRLMVFLGETSFAFYLFHQTIISLVERPGTSAANWATTWIVAFVLTLFAAAGAHLLFERPVRAQLRRVLDPIRVSNPNPPPSSRSPKVGVPPGG